MEGRSAKHKGYTKMAVKDVALKLSGIKGFIPLSMLDWEGRLVTTVFTGGCNFRCPFCHNASLVLESDTMPDLSADILKDMLTSKAGWVDGVCITGGEPTITSNLADIIRFIKRLDLGVKLDTNGTQPEILKDLVEEGLLNAVAMDIKTSFKKYPEATRQVDLSGKVKESIGILVAAETSGKLELEFRTTVVPTFVEQQDVLEIAKYLKEAGAKRYYLQQFNPKSVMEANAADIKPFSNKFIVELAQEATKLLPTFVRV